MPRFRRFSRKRRRPRRKRFSRFTRRVLRAELAASSIKKVNIANYVAETMPQGDGTGRIAIALTPWSEITQGTSISQFEGNEIYPKGVSIKGLLYNAAATTNEVILRFTYFWSHTQAAYGSGVIFGSGTTAAANPAQTPPFANPSIFDSNANAWSPFVADNYSTRFDPTNIKIIKSKTFVCNPGGVNNWVKPFKIYFRHPRRKLVYRDIAESTLGTTPNYPKSGQYYIIIQIFGQGGTSNISATSLASMDMQVYNYWKDGPN